MHTEIDAADDADWDSDDDDDGWPLDNRSDDAMNSRPMSFCKRNTR